MLKDALARCPGCMSPLGPGCESCPSCGCETNIAYDTKYLAPGALLNDGRYFVGKLEMKNGGGATYLGFDNKRGVSCWIREYFPTTLAHRNVLTGEVSPIQGQSPKFKALISDFVDVCNEVKRLAVTEDVVPVLDMFAYNNTVYAVYKHMNVISFDEYLLKHGGKLPVEKTLDMLLPFCNMLSSIHDHGYIHRGISPYTVFVDENDRLYLWCFSLGAERTANSEIESELFNGYSAPEQYASNGWQGPWTDIYALAALFYRTVSGFVPPKSTLIGEDRPLASLDDLVMDIPKNISDAVNDAMALDTEIRTHAIYVFTSRLIENGHSSTAVYDTQKARDAIAPVRGRRRELAQDEKDGGFKYAIIALVFTVVVLIGGLLYVMNTYFPDMMKNEPQKTQGNSVSQQDDEAEGTYGESADAQDDQEAQDEQETTVPRFVGQMASIIQNDEDYKGRFDFSIEEEYNEDFPEGVVFKQSPEENTLMPNRGRVILYVSKGAELVQMPNIIGLSFEEAEKTLNELELPFKREERYAAGAVAGSIVGTTPAPGIKVDPTKDEVTLFVMPAGGPAVSQNSADDADDSTN